MAHHEDYPSEELDKAILPPGTLHETGVVGLIDLDEFEEDRRDPEWQKFLDTARESRRQLRQEGRMY